MHYLNLSFWLKLNPAPLSGNAQKILIAICAILFIFFVASKLLKKKTKGSIYGTLLNKYSSFAITNSLIGVALLFFTYQKIVFFSSRFWFIIWLVEMIVWKLFILKDVRKIPAKRKEREEEEKFKKYIPR